MAFDINQEIMKVAVADIDIEALAKKFKPLVQKQIETEFNEFIENYEVNFDDFYEIMHDYLNKVAKPELRKKLGLTTIKRK